MKIKNPANKGADIMNFKVSEEGFTGTITLLRGQELELPDVAGIILTKIYGFLEVLEKPAPVVKEEPVHLTGISSTGILVEEGKEEEIEVEVKFEEVEDLVPEVVEAPTVEEVVEAEVVEAPKVEPKKETKSKTKSKNKK